MSAAPKDPMAPSGYEEVHAIVGFGTAQAKAKLSLFKQKIEFMKSRYMRLAGITQLFMTLALTYQMEIYRDQMIHDMQANRALRMQQATKHFTDTVGEYGPTSREAIAAGRELGLVRNQESIMQSRVQIMQEHQMSMYMGIGVSSLTQITMLYATWGDSNEKIAAMRAQNDATRAAKNETLMAMRSATLTAAVATAPAAVAADVATLGVGIAPTAEMDPFTQAEIQAEQSILAMHAGGVTRTSGFRYLEAGESVSPQMGWDRPQVYTITLKPIPGTPTWQVATELFDRVGKHKGAYN